MTQTQPDAGPEVDAGEPDSGPPPDAGFCVDDQGCQDHFNDPNKLCDDIEGATTFKMCVDRCFRDDDCERYQIDDLGLRCNEQTGRCMEARGCNNDSNCWQGLTEPDHYCNMLTGQGCRCVTESNPYGTFGVCRRRFAPCEECTDHSQCGESSVFDPPGRCLTLQNDQNALLPDGGIRRYCFYQEAACGCGLVRTVDGVCAPQNGSCQSYGCARDSDCPFGSVCKVGSCLCEPRCLWNFDSKGLNPPGCPPGTTCWVDEENLNPDSPYFGAGRCREPCNNDIECNSDLLVCRNEEVTGGVADGRCRPGGECMDDFECPEQPQDAIYLGYCDRATLTCVDDSCRIGTDPITGLPFDDCRTGWTCVDDNGKNVCREMKCAESGGARLACSLGQYCCGEDRSGDGQPELCPLSGLLSNNCFPADNPPFCTPCSSHADCAQYPNPSGSTLRSLCRYAGNRPGQGPGSGLNVCMVATFNDFTPDSWSVPRAHRGCPAKYAIEQQEFECATNAECGPNGTCGAKPGFTLPDGGPIMRCLCLADGTATKTFGCPGDVDAGTHSYCRYGPPNTTTVCIGTIYCMPTGATAYLPVAEGGCGL